MCHYDENTAGDKALRIKGDYLNLLSNKTVTDANLNNIHC